MMSTSFTNGPDTDPSFHTFRPGAKVLDAYERQPVGPCVPTLHLYGYWRDQTKFGPLIYLSHSITVAPTTPRTDATPGTAQVRRDAYASEPHPLATLARIGARSRTCHPLI